MPSDSDDSANSAPTASEPRQRILLVTGLLGAGKTTVLRVLEDLGWEALDNFPIRLLERLIDTTKPQPQELGAPLAIGFDARTRGFNPHDIIERVKKRWREANICSDTGPAAACEGMIRGRAAGVDDERRNRTQLTLQALRRGLGAVTPVYGRKSVLLFSEGFVDDPTSDQRTTAAVAREANAAIYFVDVRGLTGTATVTLLKGNPVAFDDTFTVAEDTTLTVMAPGVLGNDSPGDGGALAASRGATDSSTRTRLESCTISPSLPRT